MTNDVRPAEDIEILGRRTRDARGASTALEGHDVPVDKVGYVDPPTIHVARTLRRPRPC